eukprot:TRINITY_DN111940_c0_g1_i1.p1 TRINITY_DN111940_c0_g1~~TRINITY_DN111940_c0_g1_i1.p1  ORF type:complete len:353 (+),score=52.17 TRINITY_DN111940_c0_g1_i1:43-1101(+)
MWAPSNTVVVSFEDLREVSFDEIQEVKGAETSREHRILPLLLAFSITASTVAASQLTRSAQSGLHAPFFVMYTHLAALILCWPIAGLVSRGGGEVLIASRCDVAVLLPLTVCSSYAYVLALSLAPASIVQILFGVAPSTVATLSSTLLKESLTTLRMCAVGLAFLGTTVIGLGAPVETSHGQVQVILGGAAALLAAAAAAGYKVLFKVRLGQASYLQVLGFLGTYGAVANVFGLPISLLLAYAGLEDHWWASPLVNWWLVVGSAAVDLMYSLSVAFCLAVASPVFVALGVLLGAPANMVVDLVVNGLVPSAGEIAGGSMITVSFLLLALKPDEMLGRSDKLFDLYKALCEKT